MERTMKALMLLREASYVRGKSDATDEQVLALLSQAETFLPLGVSVLWSEEHASFAVFPFDPEEFPDVHERIYRWEHTYHPGFPIGDL